MIKIFVLASGRSGTKYLSSIFKNNVKNCISKHEPYPTMFGIPIYWYQAKKIEEIKKLFIKKKKRITRCKADVYIETNNAFLKSFSDVAVEFFPDLKLIHIIRNPLTVARSQLNRHIRLNKMHFPLRRFYLGDDGRKYFKWTLTGKEDIFRAVTVDSLTPYQYLVLQWIEIENRAMRFLDTYQKHDECYTLFAPEDLNNGMILEDMFRFFGLERKGRSINFGGAKNKNRIPTIVREEDQMQFEEVIGGLPESYLKIFRKEPYTRCTWSKLLR
ncbi:MAG: hypothetical protein AB1847_22225 [bacterium]